MRLLPLAAIMCNITFDLMAQMYRSYSVVTSKGTFSTGLTSLPITPDPIFDNCGNSAISCANNTYSNSDGKLCGNNGTCTYKSNSYGSDVYLRYTVSFENCSAPPSGWTDVSGTNYQKASCDGNTFYRCKGGFYGKSQSCSACPSFSFDGANVSTASIAGDNFELEKCYAVSGDYNGVAGRFSIPNACYYQ
ncbi:MAG: hypothetical protein LBL21_03650 [Rickettsiales bacterium]|jgi:hypothetical protein|nr:hypothetical protein [Rickettsiales bacterium]